MNESKGSGDAASNGPSITDEELMAAFARGEKEAFEELFSRYQQPLYGFFRRRVPDRAHAEELTQETFLALVKAAPRYEARASLRTYLYAIAYQILKGYRRKSAFRQAFFGSSDRVKEATARDRMEAEIQLRDAIGKLERVEREILLLREYEELRYTEIAEVLGIPVNSVRSRLFRSRQALRELLAGRESRVRGTELRGIEEQA